MEEIAELRKAMINADSNPSTMEIEKPYDMESMIPLKNGKEVHFLKVPDAGFS